MNTFTCLECSEMLYYRRTFNQHLSKRHGCTAEEQVLRIVHSGMHPLCECSCGQRTNFCTKENRFYERLRGHASPALKKKRGEAVREFNLTADGQQVLLERSKKMNEFYRTDAGQKNKQYSRDRNVSIDYSQVRKSLIEFNQTDEGKQVNQQRGKKVGNWYISQEGQDYVESKRLRKEIARERLAAALEVFEIIDFDEKYEGLKKTTLETVCKACSFRQQRSLQSLIGIPRCFACQKFPEVSQPQREIYEYIQSLGIEVFTNDWKTLGDREIDVWIPSRNFAIEHNGLYWHSEKNRWKEHNETKLNRMNTLALRRFIIFEDEWRDKRPLVESMVRYRLGLATKLHGRKLSIREISSVERKKFFEFNHLDGDTYAEKAWGLLNGSEIVCAISLRKPFHRSMRECSFELARFATLRDHSVCGGLGKLTKVAVEWLRNNHPGKSLVTYVDCRVGNGNGYEQAGFVFKRKTAIRFWWTDMKNRYNRFKFKAGNGKTEKQVAEENGVVRIYGCSNLVYQIDI